MKSTKCDLVLIGSYDDLHNHPLLQLLKKLQMALKNGRLALKMNPNYHFANGEDIHYDDYYHTIKRIA